MPSARRVAARSHASFHPEAGFCPESCVTLGSDDLRKPRAHQGRHPLSTKSRRVVGRRRDARAMGDRNSGVSSPGDVRLLLRQGRHADRPPARSKAPKLAKRGTPSAGVADRPPKAAALHVRPGYSNAARADPNQPYSTRKT